MANSSNPNGGSEIQLLLQARTQLISRFGHSRAIRAQVRKSCMFGWAAHGSSPAGGLLLKVDG